MRVVMLAMSLLIREEEKSRGTRTNNTVRVTGSTADAAASCGDDTTEPGITSLKGGMHTLRKTAGGQICTALSHAPLIAIYQQGGLQHLKETG